MGFTRTLAEGFALFGLRRVTSERRCKRLVRNSEYVDAKFIERHHRQLTYIYQSNE